MPLEETSKKGVGHTTFSLFGPEQNHSHDQSRGNHFPKLDRQCFDGSHPAGWLPQMDQYFHLHNITDLGIKLQISILYLDFECFRWWQWHVHAMGYTPVVWPHFYKALCAHFDLTKLK